MPGAPSSAEWALVIPEPGAYTVRMWWANQSRRAWSTLCVVAVHSNGASVTTTVLDLNQQGDQVCFSVLCGGVCVYMCMCEDTIFMCICSVCARRVSQPTNQPLYCPKKSFYQNELKTKKQTSQH